MPRLLIAILWGLGAFVVTYIVLLIIVAILNNVGVPQAAEVLNRFAWLLSLLVGIVYGWSRFQGVPPAVR